MALSNLKLVMPLSHLPAAVPLKVTLGVWTKGSRPCIAPAMDPMESAEHRRIGIKVQSACLKCFFIARWDLAFTIVDAEVEPS